MSIRRGCHRAAVPKTVYSYFFTAASLFRKNSHRISADIGNLRHNQDNNYGDIWQCLQKRGERRTEIICQNDLQRSGKSKEQTEGRRLERFLSAAVDCRQADIAAGCREVQRVHTKRLYRNIQTRQSAAYAGNHQCQNLNLIDIDADGLGSLAAVA